MRLGQWVSDLALAKDALESLNSGSYRKIRALNKHRQKQESTTSFKLETMENGSSISVLSLKWWNGSIALQFLELKHSNKET